MMTPEQSRNLVRDTFETNFDRQKFGGFVDRLLKKVDFSKQFIQSGFNIRRAFADKVNSFERIGQYADPDGKVIDILIVNLKRDTTLERGRTGLRNFAADYLQSDRGIGKAAVLIAYVPASQTDWRFSYVTLEKDLKQNEKGVFKEEITSLTPARRYSFLVGNNEASHTAQRQFYDLLSNPAPRLQNIEEAFNIEKVTKEFFAQYKELFENVRNELSKICQQHENICEEFTAKGMFAFAKDASGNKVKEPHTDDFAKKLLGQIVFLYFLQKKGWFGVERDNAWGTGDRNFLRNLFRNKRSNENFFDKVLEPLFYNTLAVKREHDWSDRFESKIPFLNGGLFEPLNGYDWVHTDINLPDSLFSNSETTSQGDRGTGILDVFDRYNFTINEAEPLEVEVAVDPEMLGKIFENLLPENIRHGSGTYYTPRVIVAYMCQQSLINYLATHLESVPREDIENFIRFGSQQRDYTEAGTQAHAEKFLPQTIIDNAQELDELLSKVTVCDPAIGSGAFPVGMMHEIVKAREALQAVESIEKLSQYDLKRQTIENSLYGVDIDSGAVEIAKLRLWLSLIVDEADFQTIEPLPNLDYKIMQGNSLLDEFHGVKLIDEKLFKQKAFDKAARLKEINNEISEISLELGRSNVGKQSPMFVLAERRITELNREKSRLAEKGSVYQGGLYVEEDESQIKLELLKSKHKQIFNETRKEMKERLRLEAENLEWEFIAAKLKADGKFDELAELKIHRQDRRKNYFLWHLNFPEIFQKGGFDIVISNPPYGANIDEFVQTLARLYPNTTKSFKDIYKIFIELTFSNILSKYGITAFIVPNTFLRQPRYKDLRTYLSNYKFLNLLNLGESVFEQVVVPTCVFIAQNINSTDNHFAYKDLANRGTFSGYIDLGDVEIIRQQTFLNTEQEFLHFSNKQTSLELLSNILDFKDAGINYQRVNVGLSEKGKSNLGQRLLYEGNKENTDDVEYWKGVDIDSYFIAKKTNRFVRLKTTLSLSSNERVILNKVYFAKTPKLIWRQTAAHLIVALDELGIWFGRSIQAGVIKTTFQNLNYKYLLGILNSSYIRFLYNQKVQEAGRVFPQVKLENLKQIPIPVVGIEQQIPIIDKVDYIIESKRENPKTDTREIENELDKLVYSLYGLTDEEIAIVEGRV